MEEAQQEGDLPVGDQDDDEPLELRLVVPQQAGQERDGLGAEDLGGGGGRGDAGEGRAHAQAVAALAAARVEVAGGVGASEDLQESKEGKGLCIGTVMYYTDFSLSLSFSRSL